MRTSRGLDRLIRPIAAAVIRSGSRLLVWEDYDPLTRETVCVPLAGGIEFGERGADTIARELKEEINATTLAIRYLGLIEDIYTWAGAMRHELYLLYDVSFVERHVYEREELQVVESDGTSYIARWRELSDFERGARLVPDGLLELIEAST
jgi:8-oxo-dGTP pyrophosphatase MutT (NUDIX family)